MGTTRGPLDTVLCHASPSIVPRGSSWTSPGDMRGHEAQPSSVQGRWEGMGHPAWGTFGCHQAPQAACCGGQPLLGISPCVDTAVASPGPKGMARGPGAGRATHGETVQAGSPLILAYCPAKQRVLFPDPVPANSPPQGRSCAPKPPLG